MSDVCLWHLIINWKLREVITRFWNYIRLFSPLSPSCALYHPSPDARCAAAAYFGCLAVPYCALPPPLHILDCFDNKLENKLILSFNAWNPTGNLIGFILSSKKKKRKKNNKLKYVYEKQAKSVRISAVIGTHVAFHPLQNEMREIGHKRKKGGSNMK